MILKDFIYLPRQFRKDFSDGKLTQNEFNALIWIWLNANPYNGSYLLSYEGLKQDLRGGITYDNARKIVSSLRKKQYIYFLDHKGRKGSFHVYPVGFRLTNGQIQTWDYLKNRDVITSQSQPEEQQESKSENSLETLNHNFEEQKRGLIKQFSIDSQDSEITTSYNDNDTDKNNNYRNAYKGIDTRSFFPKTHEEQRCKEIATALGDDDLRFMLSCLKKYKLDHIEKKWGEFQELQKRIVIKNKAAFFNKLVRSK